MNTIIVIVKPVAEQRNRTNSSSYINLGTLVSVSTCKTGWMEQRINNEFIVADKAFVGGNKPSKIGSIIYARVKQHKPT
jgi:hypothetical protein